MTYDKFNIYLFIYLNIYDFIVNKRQKCALSAIRNKNYNDD